MVNVHDALIFGGSVMATAGGFYAASTSVGIGHDLAAIITASTGIVGLIIGGILKAREQDVDKLRLELHDSNVQIKNIENMIEKRFSIPLIDPKEVEELDREIQRLREMIESKHICNGPEQGPPPQS